MEVVGEKNLEKKIIFILKIGDDVSGEGKNKCWSKNEYLIDKENNLGILFNVDVDEKRKINK